MYINDEKMNCRYDRGDDRFSYRVGAIIIEAGAALLATNDSADYYYSIGGGVHFGETSRDAVLREVKEETGVDYEIDRLAFIHENFFTEKCGVCKGKHFHELALYYLMKPRGTRVINSDSYCSDGKEYLKWVPIDQLKAMKVFPDFYADKIGDLPEGVQSIVSHEAE